MTISDTQSDQQILKDFLAYCKSHVNESLLDIDGFKSHIVKAQKFQMEFYSYISKVPLNIVMTYLLENSQNNQALIRCAEAFIVLIKEDILPNQKGADQFLLKDLREIGHEEIIESIRCLNHLSTSKTEDLVRVYLEFAKSLSEITLGYIPFSDDLDKAKMNKKKISYDTFLAFSEVLPKRDSLIAQLIYFSEPSMADVLELKVSFIDFSENTISYGTFLAKYPKHVMQSLQEFIKEKKENDLVFTNRLGELVNRSRLYTSFKNASAKLSPPTEIVPTDLLEKVF